MPGEAVIQRERPHAERLHLYRKTKNFVVKNLVAVALVWLCLTRSFLMQFLSFDHQIGPLFPIDTGVDRRLYQVRPWGRGGKQAEGEIGA